MKLKLSHISSIIEALTHIDPPAGKSPYKFSGKVRFKLAMNIRRLQAPLDVVEGVRQKLIDEHKLTRTPQPDGSARLEGEGFNAFSRAVTAALEADTEVDLITITEEELDLDTNPIPIQVLGPLAGTIIGTES